MPRTPVVTAKKEHIMLRQRVWSFIAAMAALTLGATSASAMHPELRFAEVAQAADLIFVGTVESQTSRMNQAGSLIVTDVAFDVEVVSATDRSRQQGSSRITLTFRAAPSATFP